MSRYSNIPQSIRGKKRQSDGTYADADFLYNYIHTTITSTTIDKRKQLKSSLDNFCTFWWRGIDAFETFGAFIVNKNDLKFYNGPGYSNSYVNPQFESAAGQLTGVNFKTQQISFTIGVYWISIEHYRQLIYWLHPYEINSLAFGFDRNHYYQVKLANMVDSNRTIIGYETVRNNPDGGTPEYSTEPRYYTEIKLTFEIQGTPCAYNWDEFNFSNYERKEDKLLFYIDPIDRDAEINSDLEAPVQASFALNLGLRTENFLNGNNQYDLTDTIWNLNQDLDMTMFSSSITLSGLSFKTGNNEEWTGVEITRTPSGNSVVYTLFYIDGSSSTLAATVTNSTEWENPTYGRIEFQEVEGANLISNSYESFINFLVQNNEITYYEGMKITCTLEAGIKDHDTSFNDTLNNLDSLGLKTLFDVTLKNLTWTSPADENQNIFDLGYDSESGVLYLLSADSEYFLLNTLSTSAKGRRIVDAMTVNTFAIPGLFNDPLFNIKDLFFVVTFTTVTENGTITSRLTLVGDETLTGETFRINQYSTVDLSKSYISLRGRTNLI